MKAITLNQAGSVEELQFAEIEIPTPADQEVLVMGKAISINPVDVKTRSGKGVYGSIKNNHPDEYDFVLDAIGGDNIDKSILVTRSGGSIISIPTGLNEFVTEKAKAKGVNGYFILVQSNGDDIKQVAALQENGVLKAHVSKTFAFENMAAAHLQVESGRTVGKVVVKL